MHSELVQRVPQKVLVVHQTCTDNFVNSHDISKMPSLAHQVENVHCVCFSLRLCCL